MILKRFVSEGMKNSPRNIYWWSQEGTKRTYRVQDRSILNLFRGRKIFCLNIWLREKWKNKNERALNRVRRNCERLTRIGRPSLRIIDSHRCTFNRVVENRRKIRRKQWKNSKWFFKKKKKKRKGLYLLNSSSVKILSLISSIF